MNIHLQDQLLPPPSTHICYNCHLEGHFAGACPLKKSRMMTNPNANLGSTYSSPQHAHLQSTIHGKPWSDQLCKMSSQPNSLSTVQQVWVLCQTTMLHISATNVVGVTMLDVSPELVHRFSRDIFTTLSQTISTLCLVLFHVV